MIKLIYLEHNYTFHILPSGVVTIGVAKPLPCSTVVGGEKANGHSMQSSQVGTIKRTFLDLGVYITF